MLYNSEIRFTFPWDVTALQGFFVLSKDSDSYLSMKTKKEEKNVYILKERNTRTSDFFSLSFSQDLKKEIGRFHPLLIRV